MKLSFNFNGQTKNVDFTKPQAAIVQRLLDGDKATFINTHRRDGGDFVWYEADCNYWGAECVGWKAFNGAIRAIERAFNLTAEEKQNLLDKYIVE